jgi:hypothetical protein
VFQGHSRKGWFSVRPIEISDPPALASGEGELQSIRIELHPRHLEELLDALAELSFPINPRILHSSSTAGPVTVVEFPAYSSRGGEVKAAVERCGLPPESISAAGILSSESL